MNVSWTIREPKNIDKVLSRLGEPQKKQYKTLISDIEVSTDPRLFGISKKIKDNVVYVARLNDSFRVTYKVFSDEKIVAILIIGDHKEVYGKG